MSFTVTARVSARRLAYQHASLLAALDQALSLSAAGLSDVRVADACGLARSPADLYRRLFGATGTEGAPAGETVGPATAEVAAAA